MTAIPTDFHLVRVFHETAQRFPQAPAIRWGNGFIDYQTLEARAVAVARRIERAIGSGKRVAVVADKSHGTYVGLLGALYSGNTYVPLSKVYPDARNAQILDLARVDAIVYEPSRSDWVHKLVTASERKPLHIELDQLTSGDTAASAEAAERFARQTLAQVPAYILFTSGSTGTPKGVPITHASGYDHVEIAGALIEPEFAHRPDLIVVAQALPDLLPFKVVAPWLDHRLGGGARCLGISQAGSQAPFLALRTVAAYRHASTSSLALLVFLEQSTLPAAHPVADHRDLADSGVALVVSDNGGWKVTQLIMLADAQGIGAAIEAQRGEQGETAVIVGPLLTVDVRGVEILHAERRHYATAVWRRFALAARTLSHAFRTVVLADADPVTGTGFVVSLQRADAAQPGGDA